MADPVPFDALSPDEAQRLVLCSSRTVSVVAEVLDHNLNIIGDLTSRLVQDGSSVQWNGDATVHRGCTLTLALSPDDVEFDFGLNLLRLKYVLTDDVSGESAWAYVGCFELKKPNYQAGATITDEASPNLGLISCQVNGQDVTSSLDRQIGFTYVAFPLAPVLQRVSELAANCGFPASTIQVDTSAAATPMPKVMPWPLIAQTTTSTDDTSAQQQTTQPPDAPDGASGPTTWRTAWNDLAGQIGYRAVWADGAGLLRATPYADSTSRAAQFTFDASSPTITTPAGHTVPAVSPLALDRARTIDLSTFNRFVFVWANGDNRSITLTNDQDGPSSISARGGAPRGTSPTVVQINAASLVDFTAQANQHFAQAKRATKTYTAKTVPYPPAGHYDVFTYIDDPITGALGVKVEATAWTLPLNGDLMDWTWTEVSS